MKNSKNAVASHAATTTTMGSATTTVEGPATSGIPRASASQTIPSVPWIAPHGVKKNEKPQDQFDKILQNKRFPVHPKSNHSMWECMIIRKSIQSTPPDAPMKKQNKDDEEDKKNPDGFQQQQNVVNVIFGGDPSFSKRA